MHKTLKTEDYKVVSSLEQIGLQSWRDLYHMHPGATVFQSYEMYELYKATGFMKPVLIGIKNNSGILSGLLLAFITRQSSGLKGYFSTRTLVIGGPLIRPDEQESATVLHLLLRGLIDAVGGKSIFIQFRNFWDLSAYKEVFVKNGFRFYDRLNILVDTSSSETVLRNMAQSRWKQIKKGIASGASIVEATTEEQVTECYHILQELYRNKIRKPLPGLEFFLNFFRLNKNGELGIIRLVMYQDRIIGGIFCPVTKNKMIHELYVCGLDKEYKQLYPSVIATWSAIDYALKHDIPVFDFMGVGIPNREYGVREFKARFGGEMTNYGRYARVNNRFLYLIAELGYNILTLTRKI